VSYIRYRLAVEGRDTLKAYKRRGWKQPGEKARTSCADGMLLAVAALVRSAYVAAAKYRLPDATNLPFSSVMLSYYPLSV